MSANPMNDIEQYSIVRLGDGHWSAASLAAGEVIVNCVGATALDAFDALINEEYRILVQARATGFE